MTKFIEMKIADVKIAAEKRRPLDMNYVERLVESILDVGLIHPITVTAYNELIAGYHRIEAYKKLGWDEIPAQVLNMLDLEARLLEIDENLIRNELTPAQRIAAQAERKEIYEIKHPLTKRGVAQAVACNAAQGNSVTMNDKVGDVTAILAVTSPTSTYVKDVASKTGKSERAIYRDLQIASSIDPEVLDIVKQTPVGDSLTDLEFISKQPPAKQKELAKQVLDQGLKRVPKDVPAPLPKKKVLPPDTPRGERLRDTSNESTHEGHVFNLVHQLSLASKLKLREKLECWIKLDESEGKK